MITGRCGSCCPRRRCRPEVERAGRERLAAAFAQERVRRSRRAVRWGSLGLGLAGVAAAAAFVIAPTVLPTAPPTSGTVAQADGKRFLLVAAASVASMPDEGAWWGSTEVHGMQFREPGGRYVLRESESIEIWLPAIPKDAPGTARPFRGSSPRRPRTRRPGAPTAHRRHGHMTSPQRRDTPVPYGLSLASSGPGRPRTGTSASSRPVSR